MHAVEVDRRLEPALAEVVARSRNVVVHWADAMRMPLEDLEPPPTVMVSNLPYAIATPALVESLWRLPAWSAGAWWPSARWSTAGWPPGGRLYGAPSVLVQLTAEPTFRRAVGREVFAPRPRSTQRWWRCAESRRGRRPRCGAGAGRLRSRRKTSSTRSPPPEPTRPRPRPRSPRSGHRAAVRPEQVAPAGFAALAEALSWTGVTLAAPAKLNLRLLVGPRAADGYHPLRTILVALDGLADTVTVAPRRRGG